MKLAASTPVDFLCLQDMMRTKGSSLKMLSGMVLAKTASS